MCVCLCDVDFVCRMMDSVLCVCRFLRDTVDGLLSLFTWTNVKKCYRAYRAMSYGRILFTVLSSVLSFLLFILVNAMNVIW